jgi:hypothetical protein
MKKISKNSYYSDAIDSIANSMSEEEYIKAKEFYRFLVNITECKHGILSIDREKLIDIAAAYMKCSPLEAYNILTKMKGYGWIKTLDMDYIIVDIEREI